MLTENFAQAYLSLRGSEYKFQLFQNQFITVNTKATLSFLSTLCASISNAGKWRDT